MLIFEIFPQISGLSPKLKFCPDPRQKDPPNIWRIPSTEKFSMHYCIPYFWTRRYCGLCNQKYRKANFNSQQLSELYIRIIIWARNCSNMQDFLVEGVQLMFWWQFFKVWTKFNYWAKHWILGWFSKNVH